MHFVYFLFVFASGAYCQSLAKLKVHGRLVAYIVGSTHHAGIDIKSKYFQQMEPMILGSDYLLMESDPERLPTSSVRESIFLGKGSSLKTIAKTDELVCLQRLPYIDWASKGGSGKTDRTNLGPLGFVLYYVQPYPVNSAIYGRGYKNESVDGYAIRRFKFLRKPIQEFEGFHNLVDSLMKIDEKSLARISENYCSLIVRSDYPRENQTIDFQQMAEKIENGSMDSFRKMVSSALLSAGWSKEFLHQFLQYRDEINAARIDAFLKKSNLVPLILVGAVHLGGEDGLLAKLRKLNYEVEPN